MSMGPKDKNRVIQKSFVCSCDKKCVCGKRSLTKQSFKDEVNINSIIGKYARTGMITHVNKKQPFYGDVSSIQSYQDSLNVVVRGRELFDSMSSTVRARFSNDVNKMIEFLSDEGNLDEAVKLGICLPRNKAVVPPDVKNGEVIPPVVK